MESPTHLLSIRSELQKATSPEDLLDKTKIAWIKLLGRYHPLREYVAEGNIDIQERLSFLKEHVVGDFLDIGSYDGYFVFELEKLTTRAVGVDMLDESLALAESERMQYPASRAEFVKGFAERLPFPDHTFDTTLLSHTLEHVFDPEKAIVEAVRVTKEGGSVIAIVPTELGNEPTHLRVVDTDWLRTQLSRHGTVSPQHTVGEGVGFICKLPLNKLGLV